MSGWHLPTLLSHLHGEIQQGLATARQVFGHPGTKGAASEAVWLEMLERYLPERYRAVSAHVVDSEGNFSDQIDVVVHDRQYSPFLLRFKGQTVVPAESVYAVFEAKQAIDAQQVAYAAAKVASVRRLHRTSLPIPHAGGTYPAKPLQRVLGGILTFESEWRPPLGDPLASALAAAPEEGRLDLGCVAAHGTFVSDEVGKVAVTASDKAATAFLFELIARLQEKATVPMIDVRAYARWLHVDVAR